MYKYSLIIALGLLFWGCSNVELKKEYYSNGKLKSEKRYENGKLNGESKEYSEGGRILNRKHWGNDKEDTADYYYQYGEMLRVIYNAVRGTNIFYKDKADKFITFKDEDGMAYSYSYQDTIMEGESFSFNVQLFMLTSDSTSKCVVEAGMMDKSDTIEKSFEFSAGSIDSVVKCKIPSKGVGNQIVCGVFKFPGKVYIKQYPFKLDYYVKPK